MTLLSFQMRPQMPCLTKLMKEASPTPAHRHKYPRARNHHRPRALDMVKLSDLSSRTKASFLRCLDQSRLRTLTSHCHPHLSGRVSKTPSHRLTKSQLGKYPRLTQHQFQSHGVAGRRLVLRRRRDEAIREERARQMQRVFLVQVRVRLKATTMVHHLGHQWSLPSRARSEVDRKAMSQLLRRRLEGPWDRRDSLVIRFPLLPLLPPPPMTLLHPHLHHTLNSSDRPSPPPHLIHRPLIRSRYAMSTQELPSPSLHLHHLHVISRFDDRLACEASIALADASQPKRNPTTAWHHPRLHGGNAGTVEEVMAA